MNNTATASTASTLTAEQIVSKEFKLIQFRFAVRIEGAGMKHRGGSARLKACKYLGVSTKTTCAQLIPLLTAAIAAERERI